MQTTELVAGPQMDMLVAERVMDAVLSDRERRDRSIVPSRDHMYRGIDGIARTSPPHYSTDIAAAFQVIDKVRERWQNYFGLEWTGYQWEATIPIGDGCKGEGETASLAICRAALAAAGHD